MYMTGPVIVRGLWSTSSIGNETAPNSNWKPKYQWNLQLSSSFWLLLALRCATAVCEIHKVAPIGLNDVQRKLDGSADYSRLHDMAIGAISWQEYESGPMVKQADVEKLFIACSNQLTYCAQRRRCHARDPTDLGRKSWPRALQ